MAYRNNDILNSFNKLARKFMAFTKHQKTFVLFLFVFTAAVILLPMLSVEPTSDDTSGYHLWIWNLKLFKSFLIMLISLAGLYGRNLHSNVKAFMVKCFGFRESEPILNFMFLWMIVSVYMPMLDIVAFLPTFTGSISLSRGIWVQLLILLVGIIIAIKEVRKAASQNSQKTKILNIVDDEPQQPRVENKRIVQNLFDEEDMD
ncbi:hypothetical protein HXK74_02360 [Candidatus Gracilibacteria bacterium]|nr:hypothetical protein [Candidatus Gracilibacteria bacterium]